MKVLFQLCFVFSLACVGCDPEDDSEALDSSIRNGQGLDSGQSARPDPADRGRVVLDMGRSNMRDSQPREQVDMTPMTVHPDAGRHVDAAMTVDLGPRLDMRGRDAENAPDVDMPLDVGVEIQDVAVPNVEDAVARDLLDAGLIADGAPDNPEDALAPAEPEFIYETCNNACCPGFPWRRPGGFWSDLAGHTPDWRPTLPRGCVFGVDVDACDRPTTFTTTRNDCEPDQCDQCELNLNEYRLRRGYSYDVQGHLLTESIREMRHIDFSNDVFIRHTYDERGLRTTSAGQDLPEEGQPRSVFLRYEYDEMGRLIREEAIHERFRDFEPVPWEPERISTFHYFADRVEERLDSDADGITDMILNHVWPIP